MCKPTAGCLEEEPKVGKWREKFGSGWNREVGTGEYNITFKQDADSTFFWPSTVLVILNLKVL